MIIIGNKFEGIFIERVNRFLVKVDLNNEVAFAHLRDSGRLRELLLRGRKILLLKKDRKTNPRRKTNFEVLAVKNDDFWVLINPYYHTILVEEYINNREIAELSHCSVVKKEVKVRESRLDFRLECDGKDTYLEVKGCTLAVAGIGLFPDAPTERGQRHLQELINLTKEGYDTFLFFVAPRPDINIIVPNWVTDPLFTKKFEEALKSGVKVIGYTFVFDGEKIVKYKSVKVTTPRNLSSNIREQIEEELKSYS